MPVDYTFDHKNRLVIATAHGQVVLREILDYFDAVAINEAAAYGKLFDARDMDPQLSDDDMMVIGARVSAYAAYDPRGAVAAVAVTVEARDAVRRYMNFAGAKRPVQLFSTLDEAREWLLAQDPA
ncbi:MAG TPA: hypothetical protein VKY24_13465 [Reyranella sp.]|nr:hypothetical protein [Reyranella sp.]